LQQLSPSVRDRVGTMSRIMDGIKELLKGKEEPEYEYRYRTGYDQRQAPESVRYYGYPASATSEVRHGYQRPYGESREGYRNGYDRSESEYRRGYGGRDSSPRRKSSSRHGSRRENDDDNEVIELMVPMCCDKCKEKVEEELGEVEGVESVHCDQYNDRVTVRGSDIDTDRCLVKAERAVKKKCELISKDSDDEDSKRGSRGHGYYAREENSGGRSGRPSLGRLPSFASGRTVYSDGVGPRGQDYEEKDYNGFRRMPSFSKHRHHDAEYISSFNQRPEPRDSRRDYYNVRRMPSFNRHRHHDAEYINTGDLEYSPRTFYERNAGSPYTTAYNERPMYQSQVSFSRLPVGNPSYVKHIEY
jgi:copper chaperone CopZ